MPVKVSLEILLISLIGGGIGLFLFIRFFWALRSGRIFSRLREVLFLIVYLAVALFLGAVFLPCFGSAVCRGPTSEKWIALTFDDGPNEPYTSEILDILEREKVPATFFLLGKNIERYPDVVRRMVRDGFPVGNHTWDHRPLLWMGATEVRGEIEGWEKAMTEIGIEPLPSSGKLFRAPHGWKTPVVSRVLDEKGYRLIGWTRGVWDSDRPPVEVLYTRLTRRVKNGEIILLHDGGGGEVGVDRSQTVKVLPQVIAFYRDRGFRFGTIQELVEQRQY